MGQIVVNQSFNNFEKFASSLRSWDVDFYQIRQGSFCANLIQYISGDLLLTRASLNRSFFQQGNPPEARWTFAVTGSSDIRGNFKGPDIANQSLIIYPPGSEINATSHSTFDVLTFSAPEHFLELLAQKQELPELRHYLKDIEVLMCEKKRIDKLRSLLIQLLNKMTKKDLQANDFPDQLWSETIIPETLLKAVYHHDNREQPSPVFLLRDGAFNQAIACIQTNARENITVNGLTHQTGVSQRTLEYVFQEKTGMSPKQFIRTFRLNRVKKELTRSNYNCHKVTDIAMDWNFSHMGQFSKDYKKLFGELPSKTLGR